MDSKKIRFVLQSTFVILALFLASCNETSKKAAPEPENPAVSEPAKSYSNARFRGVTVQKTAENTYAIKGKAQIFEANLSWVVEDGHNEILKGYQTADAGAPEWGNFSFEIEVEKQRPNSTLMLILFEISAKDGSRQHELPIPLG